MNFRVPYEKWKHTRKIRCIWRRCTYRSRAICTYAYDTHQQQQKRNRKWDKQDGFRVSLKLYYTYLFIKLWNTSAYLYRQINAYPDTWYLVPGIGIIANSIAPVVQFWGIPGISYFSWDILSRCMLVCCCCCCCCALYIHTWWCYHIINFPGAAHLLERKQ